MSLHLIIKQMRQAIVVVIVYQLKSRVMVWRDERCLSPCDRLLSPPLVIFLHLIIRLNEMRHSYHYSLLAEVQSDSMESCKMHKAL